MARTALRWGGLAQIAGAALLAGGLLSANTTREITAALPALANSLLFVSSVLLLLSLPAMYARQANASGWLGLIGHALLQCGLLLLVVISSPSLIYSSFNRPYENSLTAFLLGSAFSLGLLLTSIATLRAGVFPRGAGILLLVGTAGFFFGFYIAELLPRLPGQIVGAINAILLPLALAWIGLSMWRSPAPR